MRKITILFLVIISSFACGKNNFEKNKPIRFKGTLIKVTEHFEDEEQIETTTNTVEDFELLIEDGLFQRYLSGEEGCNGAYQIKDNEFTFESGECDCWCALQDWTAQETIF